MKYLTLYLYIAGSLCFLAGSVHSLCATKRPPETDAQVVAAINELGKFAARHDIDIDETWREDGNSPWTARLYNLNGQSEIITTWEENGYPYLIDAVHAVEADFALYPKGHTGYAH